MFTVNEKFKSYLKKAGFGDLSEDDTQEFDDYNLYLELKKAFFAGFYTCLNGLKDNNMFHDEARKVLNNCDEELKLFWKEMSSNEK